MKMLVLGNSVASLRNFRWQLLQDLQRLGYQVVAVAPKASGQDIKLFQTIGVQLIAMDMPSTSLNPLKDFKFLWHLWRLMRQQRPAIMFAYTIKPVIYGSIAASLAKVPYRLAMITGLGYVFIGNSLKRRLIRSMVKWLYRLALSLNQTVFFQNPDDRALFVGQHLLKTEQTQLVAGSGVDLSYFQPAAYPQQLSFILIARLLKDKGVMEYLEAAALLKARYPQVRFLLLGGVSDNPAAIALQDIEQAVSKGDIEYLGEVEDVRPALAQASVFVLPSYREGCPHAALEAMAMARAVITTDVPGCREVVNGHNGYLVPVKDPQALASAMEQFILQSHLVAHMGQASRLLAEHKFDVQQVNQQIIAKLPARI